MQLGDFLNKMAVSGGISKDDAELISLLSNAGIATANIPDSLANKMTNGLLSQEAAKNDPDLKRYFTALALNALDSELNTLMTELEVPDEVKAELIAEKSSYKRAAGLTRKIKELEGKKAKATSGDKDKLATQIEQLNAELNTIKVTHTKEKNDLIEGHKAERINWELNNHYGAYNYVSPVSKEANIRVAKIMIEDELTQQGLKIENTDQGLRLVTKEGTDYFQNNQKVSVKDFIDKKLATEKFIAIDDKSGKTPAVTPAAQVTPPGIPPKKSAGLSEVTNVLKEYSQDLNQ